MTIHPPVRAGRTALVFLSLILSSASHADGTKAFVARPKLGAATLELPASITWRARANAQGLHIVTLNALIDVTSTLNNIKSLSAKALDRAPPCGDAVKILNAAAKLNSATTLRYDLRFRFVRRVCAGTLPVELPADVDCAAKIALSGARAIITVDVRGAANPPCKIVGAYQLVSDAAYSMLGVGVFQKHMIDLSKQIPPEFRGVTINIRSLAFDLPPAPARLRVSGESIMSKAQYAEFMARLDAVAPSTH